LWKKNDDEFIESFRFILPGYNVRPLELEAVIGIEQLKKLPNLIHGRRKNGALFQKEMANHPFLMMQKEISCSSWFGFSLLIRPNSNIKRIELIKKLKNKGFEVRPIVVGNFAKSNALKFMDYDIPYKLKNAEYLDKNGLFIGNHHYSINEAIDEIKQISV
jgi:CDP-4-dehydro-6-deoxyglucose reductase, E1